MTHLTIEEKRRLADGEDDAGFEPVECQDLFLDNHGCVVALMVVRRCPDDGRLFGFIFRRSSEESYFDDDSSELIEVMRVNVMRTEYERADGNSWRDHT